VSVVIQYGVDAISLGSMYALMALSLALLFGIMGLMNFAYGELIMAGAYTMYYLRDGPWPVLIVATLAVVTVLSILMERVAFRPLRHASVLTLLIASFALSYLLQNVALMAFGGIDRGVPPWEGLTSSIVIRGVRIPRLDIVTAGTTIVLLIALGLLLRRTMLGIHLRASTENFEMARLVGVRADTVIAAAFAITGVLAGVVALLFVARYGEVSSTVGLGPTLAAFVGCVIGGLGSLVGAAVGGFFLGAMTTILQASLPIHISPYTQALTFGLVIAILIFRPQGLVVRSARV
jgi:branched-chain amino acid transport system permease protein